MPIPQIICPDGGLLSSKLVLYPAGNPESPLKITDSSFWHAHIYGQYLGEGQKSSFNILLADLSRAGNMGVLDFQNFNPFQDSTILISLLREPWPIWVSTITKWGPKTEEVQNLGSKALFPSDWTIHHSAIKKAEAKSLMKITLFAGFSPLEEVQSLLSQI